MLLFNVAGMIVQPLWAMSASFNLETRVTLPEKMQGVVLTGHGGPEMLEWRDDLAVPAPGKGNVIIRVAAASWKADLRLNTD